MNGARTMALLGMALGLFVLPCRSTAGELSGNLQVFAGATENDDVESDDTRQDYRVNFFQPLTPWLSVDLNYRYHKDRTSNGAVVERVRSVPEIVLVYSRPTFTARLSYYEQRTTGTTPSNNFDLDSALAYLSWRPNKGPGYILQYRDESNVADVALFGHDTDSTLLQFDTVYDTKDWGLRFTHQDSGIDNNTSGYQLDQIRNQLSANYQHRWSDGRYGLTAETRLSRVAQTQVVSTGSVLAQPVRAVEGLFDIDLTPSLGTLNPALELIDGDTDTPVAGITIGGAETGRNIGVDLGLTQPVSRLEITVDALSDPSVQWDVYHSPDNFNWILIGGASGSYDDAFDRYTLLFPETTDRFFKAVNVTVNAQANVAVTEIRALVDVDVLGRDGTDSSTYRLDVVSSLRPRDDLHGTVQLFWSNDETIAAGRVSQAVDQLTLGTNWAYEIGHDLVLHADARYSESDQQMGSVVAREVQQYGAGLDWTPLETVTGRYSVTRYQESEEGGTIRTTDSVRAWVATEIYPTLSVTSEISQSNVDDRAGDFTQTVVRWIETLESEPTRNWRLGASSIVSWFDSLGIVTVSRRIGLELFSTWRITPYLTFSGATGVNEDDYSKTRHHRYALSWVPGRKLAASIYFQNSNAVGTRAVSGGGGNVSYRMNRRLTLFANTSYSRTVEVGMPAMRVVSTRLGLRATF